MEEFDGGKKRKITDKESNKKSRRYKPKVFDESKQKKKKKNDTKTPPNHTKKCRKQELREPFEPKDMKDFKISSESENMVEEIVFEHDTATSKLGSRYNFISPLKHSSRRALEFELENHLPQETTEDKDVDSKQSIFSILTSNLGSHIEDFDICFEKDVGEGQTQDLPLIDCLVNFPELFKKSRRKRLRKRINLMNILTLYTGEMGARRLRSKEKGPLANQLRMNRLIFGHNQVQHDNDIGLLVRKLESLYIEKDRPLDTVKPLDLVCYPESKEITTRKPEVKKKYKPKVVLDKEALQRWNILMANDFRGGKRLLKNDTVCEGEEKEWKDERFLQRVDTFVNRLNIVQGNREFSRWNGSVVDSVVGVYLTQNVSDASSSSAYMEVASRYKVPEQNNNSEQCLLLGPINQNVSSIQSLNDEKGFGLSQDEIGEEESADYVKNGGKEEKADVDDKKSAKGKKVFDWDEERRKYSCTGLRHVDTMDSVDWNAVRDASREEIVDAIKKREFLIDAKIKDKGDLEWLRNAPADVVQGYLRLKKGLGLKSIECIRLLALNQHAFPVDVNVARIATRLGWVALQELPDDINFDQLEEFPNADDIQKYLWSRLCALSTVKLYELHYHLITFGKFFCTKKNPNCSACPLKDECKHFASANSRSNLNLPAPIIDEYEEPLSNIEPENISNHDIILEISDSAVELAHSPELYRNVELSSDVSEQEGEGVLVTDIEDIPEIRMPKMKEEEYIAGALEFYHMHRPDLMNALVPVEVSTPEHIKSKITSRLKSIHIAYVLVDGHPLLESFDKRIPGDRRPYLIAIWDSTDIITGKHGVLSEIDENEQVRGTILIPSQTAMGGRFPLNGTYFQINEVFADHESSYSHILISKKELSRLQTQPLYCGTSIYSICRGMSLVEIMYCFIRGSICVRGFNRHTRGPMPLRHSLFGGSTSKKKKDEERYEYEDRI